LRILDSKQRESIVLQLCCNFPCPFFQLPGGWFSELSPPPPIANFGFETTGMNCAPIALNCAAIFFNCTRPFFNYLEGGFRKLDAPLWIPGPKQLESIVLNCAAIPFTCAGPFSHDAITRGPILRNCTYFLFENCGPVLRDTKFVSPENSFRPQNFRIRSLELEESIVFGAQLIKPILDPQLEMGGGIRETDLKQW